MNANVTISVSINGQSESYGDRMIFERCASKAGGILWCWVIAILQSKSHRLDNPLRVAGSPKLRRCRPREHTAAHSSQGQSAEVCPTFALQLNWSIPQRKAENVKY